jgi:hypothetical protein
MNEDGSTSVLRRALLYGLLVLGVVVVAVAIAVWLGAGTEELPFNYGGFD